MKTQLCELIRVGETVVAAVAVSAVNAIDFGGGLSCHGGKRPVALLVARHGDEIAARDITGSAIEPEDFERNYPGLLAAFAAALDQPGTTEK